MTIEDRAAIANLQFQQAHTIARLVDVGFTPASAKDAVLSDDFSVLAIS